MSAISIVRAILAGDAAISSTVAARLYPVETPQGGVLPAIAISLVRETDGRHLQGQDQYPVAEIIVDSCGDSYSAADGLGEAVKTRLRDFRGAVDGVQVDYVLVDELDFFDRGRNGTTWRRRQGFSMRYRTVA